MTTAKTFISDIHTMTESEKKIRADKLLWFAMSTARRPVLAVKEELESAGLTCYVAMHYQLEEKFGRKKKVLKPALNNMLFVHTRKSIIQAVKAEIKSLYYMVRPEEGHNVPIVIPDAEMEQFIRVTAKYNEDFVYISPEDADLKKGTRVRVLSGPFAGSEGLFVKVKGNRNRRLVVAVDTIAAVSVEVSPKDVEVVTEP